MEGERALGPDRRAVHAEDVGEELADRMRLAVLDQIVGDLARQIGQPALPVAFPEPAGAVIFEFGDHLEREAAVAAVDHMIISGARIDPGEAHDHEAEGDDEGERGERGEDMTRRRGHQRKADRQRQRGDADRLEREGDQRDRRRDADPADDGERPVRQIGGEYGQRATDGERGDPGDAHALEHRPAIAMLPERGEPQHAGACDHQQDGDDEGQGEARRMGAHAQQHGHCGERRTGQRPQRRDHAEPLPERHDDIVRAVVAHAQNRHRRRVRSPHIERLRSGHAIHTTRIPPRSLINPCKGARSGRIAAMLGGGAAGG